MSSSEGGLWVLIGNPAAASGRARRAASSACDALRAQGAQVELCFTSERGQAAKIAADAVAGGAKRVITGGGDGTIGEVLLALAGSEVDLGVLPLGTANDFARSLGIPRRLAAAVATQITGTSSRVDLGAAGERLFCSVAAFGFDAEVSDAMLRGAVPFAGTAGYLFQTLRHLSSFEAPLATVSGDFGEIEQRVLLVATANTRYYGGGMAIAPDADPRDGLFDVVIVGELGKAAVLSLLPRLFWGGHVRHPAVRVERSSFVTIATTEPRVAHADGELLTHTPATFAIRRGALRVIVPA